MHFRPLHDRVVVRRIDAEEKTSGGIIIPDTAKEKPQEGEVVAVGPGARDDNGTLVELSVKAGDRILFGKWSGTEVKIDGEDLRSEEHTSELQSLMRISYAVFCLKKKNHNTINATPNHHISLTITTPPHTTNSLHSSTH